jgi:hypothetical protein
MSIVNKIEPRDGGRVIHSSKTLVDVERESAKRRERKTPDWSVDAEEVGATMHMLVRAGILSTQSAIDEYMLTPWSWDRERAICRRLESVMAEAGVSADRGWGMTLLEVAHARLAGS